MQNKRSHPGFRPKDVHTHEPLKFPKGFLWGAATSAHQVEGWNDHNDWWDWEHLQGTIADGQMSGRAAGHYNNYKEDFKIAKKLNHSIHRLSIEWSRIFPEQGKVNHKEVEHYHQVFKELQKEGLKVMLTLHHFTLPVWFAEMGGFAKKSNLKYFTEFVELVVKEYEQYVDFWITINEPNIYTLMSYVLGIWPPGKVNYIKAYKVFNNLSLAHKRAYEMIHNNTKFGKPKVGIANNIISFYSYDKNSFKQWLITKISNWGWNHWFFEKTNNYHDFIGMNYYVHQRLKKINIAEINQMAATPPNEDREMTDLDWEIFAPGFYDALHNMNSYGLPIYVTENGISTANDHRRARYIVSYLKEMYHAIKSGVDVKGYMHWSLLDNFEWDKGLKARFGLVEIDYKTLKRKVRGSAKLYAEICKDNAIDHDLLRFVGHGIGPEDVLKNLGKKHKH